ncbi:MAG: CcdB family protein [Gemmobacter sp.]
MARYDLYAAPDGSGFRLDVQADLLDGLATRVVVPVLPLAEAPKPAGRLNPLVAIDGVDCVLVTQFLSAIPVQDLGRRVGSLADQAEAVMAALDMVFVGF